MSASDPNPLASPDPWNSVAVGYDDVTRGSFTPYSEWTLERLTARSQWAPDQVRLLDVACGPGTTSLLAAERVASIAALDFSPDMLAVFRGHLEGKESPSVTLHEGDGQNLPFSEGMFHWAISMFGLMFFPDRVRGLTELHRVLRPGGLAAASGWAPVEASPAMSALFRAMQALAPDRPSTKKNVESWENPEVIRHEFEAAGFEDIEVEPVTYSLSYENADSFWDRTARGSVPLVMLKKQLGEEQFARRSEDAKRVLREVVGDKKELASTAYVAIARRPKESSVSSSSP